MISAEKIVSQPRRDPALDAVRALAIVLVVIIHSASAGFTSFPVSSPNWWGTLVWGSLARPAVPLFFLCSGALLLGRDIPLKRLYGHNLFRILAAMFFWAFLYRVYHLTSFGGGDGVTVTSLIEAAKHTILLHHEFHFYYLHVIILVYVFLPIARVFVRNSSKRELEYALIFWLVTGIIFPVIKGFWPFSLVTQISGQYTLNYTYASIGYTVLGHYLYQYGKTVSRRCYALFIALGFAITFTGTAVLSLSAGQLSELFLSGWSPGPLLMSAGIFGLFQNVQNWPNPLRYMTFRLSQASFCVYLVHVFFLYLLKSLGITASAGLTLVSVPGVTVLILAFSLAAHEALRRIPIVKTYLI